MSGTELTEASRDTTRLDDRLVSLCLEMSRFADHVQDELGFRPTVVDSWCLELGELVVGLRATGECTPAQRVC